MAKASTEKVMMVMKIDAVQAGGFRVDRRCTKRERVKHP